MTIRTLAAAALACGLVAAASAVPIHAVDVTTVGNNNNGYSVGWEFTLSTTSVVTHLGKFTGASPANSDVALYARGTGGPRYALTTVLATSPSEASGAINARYVAIPPTVLYPGNYVVYSQGNGEAFVEWASAQVYGPGITWLDGIANGGSAPLPATTPSFSITNGTPSRYYGAMFKYEPLLTSYTGAGATAGGGGNLNIGREFTVTDGGIQVWDLGVWDYQGNGLVNSHVVTLFSIASLGANPTAVPIASVTVPNGTTAPLDNGFRYTLLTAPIVLLPGNYSVIAYGLNGSTGDPYGDNGGLPAAGNHLVHYGFDPYQFTANVSPAFPTGGDGNNHSSASFHFQSVPEPCTLALFGLGGLGMAWRRRRAPRA